jgi:hypothetical protein
LLTGIAAGVNAAAFATLREHPTFTSNVQGQTHRGSGKPGSQNAKSQRKATIPNNNFPRPPANFEIPTAKDQLLRIFYTWRPGTIAPNSGK